MAEPQMWRDGTALAQVQSSAGAMVSWSGAASLITPEPWTQDALCAQVDPDLFFPEQGSGGAGEARKVCGSCDVRVQCLAYALRTGQVEGVWGGKSARQLAKLRRSGWAK